MQKISMVCGYLGILLCSGVYMLVVLHLDCALPWKPGKLFVVGGENRHQTDKSVIKELN